MITTGTKNAVLQRLSELIRVHENDIITANQLDLQSYDGSDVSMLDRLKVDQNKVDTMVRAVEDAILINDPEGKILYTYKPENGLEILNKTVPFGSILIIYESRPDVTIEAAVTAFKAGNRILLKGGKEARNTNLVLIELWHQALESLQIDRKFVTYLELSRPQT